MRWLSTFTTKVLADCVGVIWFHLMMMQKSQGFFVVQTEAEQMSTSGCHPGVLRSILLKLVCIRGEDVEL